MHSESVPLHIDWYSTKSKCSPETVLIKSTFHRTVAFVHSSFLYVYQTSETMVSSENVCVIKSFYLIRKLIEVCWTNRVGDANKLKLKFDAAANGFLFILLLLLLLLLLQRSSPCGTISNEMLYNSWTFCSWQTVARENRISKLNV